MAGKKIKIIYKKLGREKAWGQADDYLELDPRAKGSKKLEIIIHESFHVLFPELTEEEVIKKSIRLTRTLWHEGYREVDVSTNHKLQDGSKI